MDGVVLALRWLSGEASFVVRGSTLDAGIPRDSVLRGGVEEDALGEVEVDRLRRRVAFVHGRASDDDGGAEDADVAGCASFYGGCTVVDVRSFVLMNEEKTL